MKEYMLHAIIAIVGLLGLIVIHRDICANQVEPMDVWPSAPALARTASSPAEIASTATRLAILPGDTWSQVRFNLTDLKASNRWHLDCGNGRKLRLRDTSFVIQYDRPGSYLVKLYQDKQLVAASQLDLAAPHIEDEVLLID